MSPKIKKAVSSKPAKPKKEPNFLDTVYAIVRRIPKGRVTSYGAIAERAGIRLSARMVGWAMNAAGSAPKPVPAHRVVNSKGLLTGAAHFATPTLMQELLEAEGIKVKDNQVQDFDKVFWNPPLPKKKP
ncbi:MGMT family protein [Chitinophaga barathri]|uniref:MGMT family protein n=1 Tax=Chitinophaga barathri TaxID=1647451 RepID=A0A3N4MFF9_9BACT|nr:MGMT family protein [Chitinophaga barathri]RPD40407.1 MGMT family protein [Chitinophaga barathri]